MLKFTTCIACVFIWVIICPIIVFAQSKTQFHRPETEAEKFLDDILRYDDRNPSELDKLLKNPDAESSLVEKLTERLKAAFANAETKEVAKNCGGEYIEGELCGLGFNPLTCAQDVSEYYLYNTITENTGMAIVSYAWPKPSTMQTPMPMASYTLKNDGKNWLLDGVACDNGIKFNVNSGK